MSIKQAPKSGRWYDKYPELARYLEALKDLDHATRNALVRAIKKIIITDAPDLIDNTVMNYPLTYKRRWYDADPLLWLTINGLGCCEQGVVQKVIVYLRGEFKVK